MEHKKKKGRLWLVILIVVIVLILQGAAAFWIYRNYGQPSQEIPQPIPQTVLAAQETEPAAASAEPPQTEPTQPALTGPVQLVTTATIGALGDIIPDISILNACEQKDGSYSFDGIFRFLSNYSLNADYNVISLESPLAGSDAGRYTAFPLRNVPDSILDSLKGAGFSMVLTANNHCYDYGHDGLTRTIETIESRGMQALGTSTDASPYKYTIVDVNGIRVGMLCYTIRSETPEGGTPDTIYLNGQPVDKEDEGLICSYPANQTDLLCAQIQWNVNRMREDGAEAIVVFLHWGTLYSQKADDNQKTIAQRLCDMGVDVVVGNHPHVVEPITLLTGSADPTAKTLCLYSLGNSVSNQRYGTVKRCSTSHTEDGVYLTFTFSKYSDGKVYLSGAELMPLWMHVSADLSRSYTILPLDASLADSWQSRFNLNEDTLQNAQRSAKRTGKIADAGLAEVQTALAERNDLREADYLDAWVREGTPAATVQAEPVNKE